MYIYQYLYIYIPLITMYFMEIKNSPSILPHSDNLLIMNKKHFTIYEKTRIKEIIKESIARQQDNITRAKRIIKEQQEIIKEAREHIQIIKIKIIRPRTYEDYIKDEKITAQEHKWGLKYEDN